MFSEDIPVPENEPRKTQVLPNGPNCNLKLVA